MGDALSSVQERQDENMTDNVVMTEGDQSNQDDSLAQFAHQPDNKANIFGEICLKDLEELKRESPEPHNGEGEGDQNPKLQPLGGSALMMQRNPSITTPDPVNLAINCFGAAAGNMTFGGI